MKKTTVRPIRIEGDIAYVPLTKGYEAIIDAADVPMVEAWAWTADVRLHKDGSIRTVYAFRGGSRHGGSRGAVRLHRELLGLKARETADHIDGDGLNNRRSNLRPVTKAQNAQNTRIRSNNRSGAKGVSWHKRANKWVAQIVSGGRHLHLGLFKCRTAAAIAYAKASAELHGSFGRVT